MNFAFSRVWAMPNADTFSIPPIGDFVKRYLAESEVSVDPFARNFRLSTWTNDLNPDTKADHHCDAIQFLNFLHENEVKADLVVFDPPYSSRQISEVYQQIGSKCGKEETQNGKFYSDFRNAMMPILAPDAVVLSFGWNSVGMGRERGFAIEEIMLVCHGGAHNDTICLAERMVQPRLL
jgi:hypothetical protein